MCCAAGSAGAAGDVDTRPVVYLTFDDGPSADLVTEKVLALLARYDAQATFFVTGERTRKNGSKISSILYAGHAIGNHTDTHANLANSSSEVVEKEFRKASDAVLNAGGPPLTCFRPPFGATSPRVNAIAAKLGMVAVKWTLDTRDWEFSVQPSTIESTLDQSGNGSVVLMHDGPIRRNKTVAALSEWLAVSGHLYQFKSLPECHPYGSTALFASHDDQEPDLTLEPETLQSLLAKLRNYRFKLIADSSQQIDQHQSQLTARLDINQ